MLSVCWLKASRKLNGFQKSPTNPIDQWRTVISTSRTQLRLQSLLVVKAVLLGM